MADLLRLSGSRHVDPVGVLWGLGAAIGLAAYFIVSAAGVTDLSPLAVAWGGLSLGALSMVTASLISVTVWRAPMWDVALAHHALGPVVPLASMGVLAAAFAYVTGIVAARRLGARLASFVGLAEVLFAAVYARVLLGEGLGAVQLAAAVLVLAGIALVRVAEPSVENSSVGTAGIDAFALLEPVG